MASDFQLIGSLDLKSPDIVAEANSPKALTNLEFSGKGISLRSRKGIIPSGQVGDFIGLHTYNYTSATTGANTEEMIAMNHRLWKQATSSFTITRAGAGPFSWHYEKTVVSGVHRFKLYDGQTLVLNYSLGTGLGEYTNGMIRIWDLINQINTNTGGLFTATLPPRSGQVNGNQTTVRSILLFAGHNFAVTDHAIFIDTGTNRFDARRIVSITGANTIDFNSTSATVEVLNGEVIGLAGVAAAAILPATLVTNTSASQTVSFQHWDHIPSPYSRIALGIFQGGTDHNPFEKYYTTRKNSTFVPPSFVNAGNNCHIFTNARGATGQRPWEDFPMKYDGQACYRSGVPSYITQAAVAAGGAGALTGTYKYSFRYIYTDARGITYTGNPSHFYKEYSLTLAGTSSTSQIWHPIFAVPTKDVIVIPGAGGPWVTITLTAGHGLNIGDTVALPDRAVSTAPIIRTVTATTATTATISGSNVTSLLGDYILRNPSLGFNTVSSQLTAAQAGVGAVGTPLLCTNSLSFFAGDVIYFYDGLRSKYVTRKLTGVTATGVYWDTTLEETVSTTAGVGSPPTDDLNMSKNFRVQIFRTKAGGNKYYFVNEIPLVSAQLSTAGYVSYSDNATDATLLVEMDDVPEIGYEHDLPPKGSFGCTHQDLLMVAGDPANPNQIAYSLPDNIEAFPLASNYTEAPSSINGGITAIASDNESRLAVFKENSYYDFSGDFTTNAFTVRAVNEGDLGIVSHASLKKVNGALIGLSKIGFARVSNGAMQRIANEISPALIQRLTSANQLNHTAAIGGLDWPNRRYRCYVPASVGFGSGASTAQSVMFVYDYEHDRWFDWSYSSSLEPSGGMTVYGGTHYHLSKSYGGSNNSNFPGQVFRDLDLDPTNALLAESYCDNHLAISTALKLVFILNDPGTDKEFLRLRVMSLYSPYELDQFIAHTLSVSTYKNFQDAVADTTFTMTFNQILDFEVYQHLPNTVARALQVNITTNTIKTCPHITGVQLIVAEPFASDGAVSK